MNHLPDRHPDRLDQGDLPDRLQASCRSELTSQIDILTGLSKECPPDRLRASCRRELTCHSDVLLDQELQCQADPSICTKPTAAVTAQWMQEILQQPQIRSLLNRRPVCFLATAPHPLSVPLLHQEPQVEGGSAKDHPPSVNNPNTQCMLTMQVCPSPVNTFTNVCFSSASGASSRGYKRQGPPNISEQPPANPRRKKPRSESTLPAATTTLNAPEGLSLQV